LNVSPRSYQAVHTPALSAHQRLRARFTEFAGWVLPLRYPAGTIEEHLATRRSVGVFDVSHLGRVLVSGRDALLLLQRAFTNDLLRVSVRKAQYTLLLNDDGGIVDDIVVLWVDSDTFVVIPNAANTMAVVDALSKIRQRYQADVFIDNITSETAMFAVQGPAFEEVCESAGISLETLPPRFGVVKAGEWILSGTGYTGERGIEVIVPAASASDVFETLARSAIEIGGGPAGLGARDTLRLEMGYPLWGNEMDTSIAPSEAGLDWVLVESKDDFVGKAAALEYKKYPRWRPIGIVMRDKGPIPRKSYSVKAGEISGTVTSGGFSPVLGRGIALARMPSSFAPTKIVAGTNLALLLESDDSARRLKGYHEAAVGAEELSRLTRLTVDIRGRPALGILTCPPFVKTSLD